LDLVLVLEVKLARLRMPTRYILMVLLSLVLQQSNTKRDKLYFLTSGQHGVPLAKLQWHTINTCLRHVAKTGVIKLDLLVFQLTMTPPPLKITLNQRNGN